MVRMSLTVPPSVHENIAYLSTRLGVTRSAFVSQILGEALTDLRSAVEQIPENPSEMDFRRFRGSSEEIISQRVESIRRLGNDLLGE